VHTHGVCDLEIHEPGSDLPTVSVQENPWRTSSFPKKSDTIKWKNHGGRIVDGLSNKFFPLDTTFGDPINKMSSTAISPSQEADDERNKYLSLNHLQVVSVP